MTTEVPFEYRVTGGDDGFNATQNPCFPSLPLNESLWFHAGYYKDLTQIPWIYYTFLAISIIVIIVGLTGNLMVIIVVLKHRSMRTTTNYYIFSLAVSDLFVTAFAMPWKIVTLMTDGDRVPVNPVICGIVEILMPFLVFTSVWTLVAISLDRYLVIVHPLKSRYFNTRARAMRNLIIIWILPFFVFSPYFYPFDAHTYYFCSEYGSIKRVICQHKLILKAPKLDTFYRFFQLVVIFLIPVGLLCFTCGGIAWRLLYYNEDDKMLKNSVKKEEKGRRKVAKMVLVVVFAFTLCWLPHYVVGFIASFSDVFEKSNFIFIQVLVYTCGFINSCMNPIIYALMSRAFRTCFWGILTICCPRYRHLVGGKTQRNNTRQQSMTAVSEGVSHTTNAHHGRRRPFLKQEMTQVTGISSDADDDICMKKMNNRGNADYSIDDKHRVIADENKEKRERLLNNLLDEADKGTQPAVGDGTKSGETTAKIDLNNGNDIDDNDKQTTANGGVSSLPQEKTEQNDSMLSSPPLSPTSPISMSPSEHYENQPLL